jgi:hypothetical protein
MYSTVQQLDPAPLRGFSFGTPIDGGALSNQSVVLMVTAEVICIRSPPDGGDNAPFTKQMNTAASGSDPPSFPIAICPRYAGGRAACGWWDVASRGIQQRIDLIERDFTCEIAFSPASW